MQLRAARLRVVVVPPGQDVDPPEAGPLGDLPDGHAGEQGQRPRTVTLGDRRVPCRVFVGDRDQPRECPVLRGDPALGRRLVARQQSRCPCAPAHRGAPLGAVAGVIARRV